MSINSPLNRGLFDIMTLWRGGEVVTRESAKLLCKGSIPFRASKFGILVKIKGQ